MIDESDLFHQGYENAKQDALAIIRNLIPCRCGNAYTQRGLQAPDCPWHTDGREVELAVQEMVPRAYYSPAE